MRTATIVGALLMSTSFAATLVLAQSPAGPEPRTEKQGIKETEHFIKEGDDVVHAVGVARAQIESTLTAYNALVSTPSKDMKRDYGKLLKEVKEMDEKVDEARKQVDEMNAAGQTYFAGRQATIANIQDPQLKKAAQARLADSEKQHGQVLASLRSARESLEPIRKELEDQIKFLGSDLNPGATTALAPNAQKLNERGKANFAKADEAIASANAYFTAMRPSK
jgi:hypothetical protein